MKLKYDENTWVEQPITPVNTVQLFITEKCNLRCKACFASEKLGKRHMSFADYKSVVLDAKKSDIDRVTILGGEPTLHPQLNEMLEFNLSLQLKTTVYTNGANLNKVLPVGGVDLRIGVMGLCRSEKPLDKIANTNWPVRLVYMLRRDNVDELMPTMLEAERKLNLTGIYVSSIKDIAITGSFWADTPDTLSNEEYAAEVQKFIDNYRGSVPCIDIARRGVFDAHANTIEVKTCRLPSRFVNGDWTTCPLDIGLNKSEQSPDVGRGCNKHCTCLMQKIRLVRRVSNA